MRSLNLVVVLCLGSTFLFCLGCSNNVAPASARKTTSEPVFGKARAIAAGETGNDLDFGFLHEDHFGCLSVNVAQVMSHDELKEVPWDSLQEQLAKAVGQKNSLLKSIERIWILLDRESVQLMMGGQSANPLVFVVDYKTSPDLKELDEAQKTFSENFESGEDEVLDLVARALGDTRIVLGSPELTNKLLGGGTVSELQRELSKLDFESDIEGLISIGPIRSTLKTAFGMAAQFGGEEAKKLASLPDTLQQVEVDLSLKGDVVLETSVWMDDPDIVAELTKLAQQGLQASAAGGDAPMGGFPMGGMTGMGGAPGGPGGVSESEMMFPLAAPPIMEKVGKQIQEDNLFSVDGDDNRIVFKLQRPDDLTELISASIQDANRGFKLGLRATKLAEVGKAMEDYYDKHKCYPPAGLVKDSKDGLPDQLNWRVGLLPFLGEQELYEKFDFNKPWDSAENLEVAKAIPEMFETDPDAESSKTCFHYPGGELGFFQDGDGQRSVTDIKDRKIWTAIVIEGADKTAVQWTNPKVLKLGEDFGEVVGKEDENGVLFLNGSFDPRMVKAAELSNVKAILTADGAESLSRKSFFKLPDGP